MADPDLPQPARPAEPPGSLPGDRSEGKPRKRKWLRRTLWGLGGIVLLLLIVVALAPALLSTAPGTSLVERLANRQVEGTIRLEGLSLGWFSGIGLREMEVYDPQETQVLALADFKSDLSLWNALRGRYHLGETSGRLNLTVVRIYDDGTTNLHDIFRIEPSEDEQGAMPDIRGRLKFDGHAGVQYMGNRDVAGDESLPVDVNFDGTEIALNPGQPLEHNLPLELRVSGQPAGQILARGTIDLASLSAEQPVIQEEVQLTSLHLPAIGTLLSAFVPQMAQLEIAGGVIDGTLSADLAQNKLAGQIDGSQRIIINRRDVPGTGYETDRFELVLDGGFSNEPLAAGEQVTLDDGTKITSRLLVDLDQLAISTDDGTLTAAALIDLLIAQTDPLANWPMLARDVSLDLKSDFATAHGEGAHLGAFALEAAADVARMNQRFGSLLTAGGAQPMEGQARLSLRTQQAQGGAVTLPLSLVLENVVLAKVDDAADAGQASRGTPGPAPQPGVISADPRQVAPAGQTPPLRLGLVRLEATATLPPPKPGAMPMPTGLSADLAVNDAERQPLLAAKLLADELAADSAGGRVALESVSLPDYARLRAALAGWVDLPEPREPVEPITMTAVASWDGHAGQLELAEPLRILLGSAELANVSALGQRQQEGTWIVPVLRANLSVPALDQLAGHFGSKVATGDPASGRITLRVAEDSQLRFNLADIAASLEGALELAMQDAAARGMALSGSLPISLRGTSANIPEEAAPLSVNRGEVILGGTSVQQQGESWLLRIPTGQVVQGVSLNPVLMELLGKYINPVFVQPEQANGLLDVTVASADTIDLANIPAANVELAFSIRELRLDNDIIAQFAEASVGETAGAIRGQLSAIPGVDRQIRDRIATMSLTEEIKDEISSIRGSITDARVSLKNGVADTRITFNVADPRKSATQPGGSQLYPLSFTGGVDLQTLSARNLSVTVPTTLIEKWAGESPKDLVQYFGERPWPKLLPQGIRIGINGTTYVPVPDPRSFEAMARDIAPRLAEALIQGQLEGALRRLRGD